MKVRRAVPADAEQLDFVLRTVWSHGLLADAFPELCARPGSCILVAEREGRLVGFVSCFVSPAARCEVELIATLPEMRGLGIAGELVRECLAWGKSAGCAVARALIREENAASRGVFARAGFVCTESALTLLLWEPEASEAELPPCATLVPVETLLYRGLWVEGVGGVESAAAISHARNRALREERDSTSLLLNDASLADLAPDLRAEAQLEGPYAWWECRL